MTGKKAKFKKEIISGFRWLVALLLLLLAYWWGMADGGIRDFWDPPYAMKYARLDAQLKKNPGRPLWLILGSSRVDDGLRPGVLEGGTAGVGAGAPLIFNFGLGGADFFRQYICLQRIVKEGIRPQRAGLEIIGALLSRDPEMYANDISLIARTRRDELDELCSFSAAPARTRSIWMQSRWNPFFKYGVQIPHQTRALRLLPLPFVTSLEPHPYDAWGWYASPIVTTAMPAYSKGFEEAKNEYVPVLAPPFKISPHADKIIRMTLDLCRKEGIEVFLFKMPEHADFQTLYSPETNAAIESYLAGIERDYGVKMIDGRSWVTDREDFLDGHHLNATGGKIFTLRFVQALQESAPVPTPHP